MLPWTRALTIRMRGTINPFNVHGLPCAWVYGDCFSCNTNTDPLPVRLKPHFSKGASRKILGSCSQHGCQSSFLDWVINFRRDASDIVEKEELLTCPMIWCRSAFKDADATVSHVFGCPRLSNGWYWCPYCKRPERFLECDKGCDIVLKPRLQKREANLSVTFFAWLSHRRSLKKSDTYSISYQCRAIRDSHVVSSGCPWPGQVRGHCSRWTYSLESWPRLLAWYVSFGVIHSCSGPRSECWCMFCGR